MSIEENKALVRRWVEEVWNQGRLDVLDELYTPDWVGHFPVSGELHGSAAHKQLGERFRQAFPEARYVVADLVAEGDRVVLRYSARGTHRGSLHGEAPTGREVVQTGINIYRVADGRLAEQWAQFDLAGMLQQMGGTG
jgi:steroid delta-isomerase-like uncharacterized protein